MTDFAMPYLIQLLKDTTATLKEVDERTRPAEEEKPAEEMEQMNGGYGAEMGGGMLMLGDGNVGMGMGMGMGGPAMIPTQQPTMGMAAMGNMGMNGMGMQQGMGGGMGMQQQGYQQGMGANPF